MCTAIAKKGNDVLYGYNLDIDPEAWTFDLYKNKKYFTVRIKVGQTAHFSHGVNSDGQFGNIPYMNGEACPEKIGKQRERIDLLVDRYIRGKYDFETVGEILKNKEIVHIPSVSLHSLLGNKQGDFLLVEPNYGTKKIEDDFAVLTNFPVLANLKDFSNPFYGKDRFDTAYRVLQNSGRDFSVQDALNLLETVKQDGRWGTKLSFVYSASENAVYYCFDGNFADVKIHRFEP